MRTIEITAYSVDELSEAALEKAHQDYLSYSYPLNQWADENKDSLEAFAKLFPIKITDWAYGGRGEGVSFQFHDEWHYDIDAVAHLAGPRLATWLWNNVRSEIYSKKYYHKDIVGSAHYKARYSKFQITSGNCPLTGYCMDESMLEPLHAFLAKPDSRDMEDLLGECFDAWVRDCNADAESTRTMEYFKEDAEANEYEFTISGKRI